MKVLTDLVRELQRARDDNIPHMNTINSLSEKIVGEEKLTVANRVREIHCTPTIHGCHNKPVCWYSNVLCRRTMSDC